MVLKRPYLILIKYFRIIHILLMLCVIYAIYKSNVLLKFFNDYLINDSNVIDSDLQGTFFNWFLFFLVVILFMVSLVLFFTMLTKKKPFKFYLYNLFVYISFLVFIIFIYSFLGKMEKSIIDILNVRIIRDLLLIFLLLQGISIIYFIIRIFGFDLKKFDFSSDLNNLNLDDDNLDEIEVNFDFDSNERRRVRKQKISNLKFIYRENRSFIIFLIVLFILFVSYFSYTKIYLVNKVYKQNDVVVTSYYNILVNNSYSINYGKDGLKITDDYLVVVDLNIRSTGYFNKFISGNLKLKIGNNVYDHTNNYNSYFTDLGNVFEDNYLSSSGGNYLFVFEIDKEDLNKNKILYYYDDGLNYKIKLEPIIFTQDYKTYNIGEEVIMDDNTIIINSYDIQDKMIINYDLCLNDVCYEMRQNIVPSLDTNYDKAIMSIDGSSLFISDSTYNGLGNIIASLGYIEYVIGDSSYISPMTHISNLKNEEKNIYYYEIRKDVMSADRIMLVLSTRKYKYYINLK